MISENDMSIILKYAKKYKLKKIILYKELVVLVGIGFIESGC